MHLIHEVVNPTCFLARWRVHFIALVNFLCAIKFSWINKNRYFKTSKTGKLCSALFNTTNVNGNEYEYIFRQKAKHY